MTRDRISQILRGNIGNGVLVVSEDGDTLKTTVVSVDDEGFVHKVSEERDPLSILATPIDADRRFYWTSLDWIAEVTEISS